MLGLKSQVPSSASREKSKWGVGNSPGGEGSGGLGSIGTFDFPFQPRTVSAPRARGRRRLQAARHGVRKSIAAAEARKEDGKIQVATTGGRCNRGVTLLTSHCSDDDEGDNDSAEREVDDNERRTM